GSNVIPQGPHLGVSTPMIKQPNPTMKHNQDWSEVDVEAMPEDFIPATAYLPNRDMDTYEAEYGSWEIGCKLLPVASTFRVAWRRMAATTGFRTMYPAIIPAGAHHVNTVICASPISSARLAAGAATLSTILSDFFIRASGSGDLYPRVVEGLPTHVAQT